MMTQRFDASLFCTLAEQWVARYGVSSLDALQRVRFVAHAEQCQRCAGIVKQARNDASTRDTERTPVASDEISDLILWPHLAEDTLREWGTDRLSPVERAATGTWIQAHLTRCDPCADRLAVILENPEPPTEIRRRTVLGRAASTPLVWKNSHSEVAWVIDQPAVGATTWHLSLDVNEGSLVARLRIEGRLVPQNWSFSIPLSTDTVLLPTLVFSDSQRAATCESRAPIDETWRATPILTADVPEWSRLVATGNEPATMVSTADATRRDITISVPTSNELASESIAAWMEELFIDLRGERLFLVVTRPINASMRSGLVLDCSQREIGAWALSSNRDDVLELKVTPHQGEIVRIRTHIEELPGLPQWLPEATGGLAEPHFVSEALAQEIAFRPSLLTAADQWHLQQCQPCRGRVASARAAGHPAVADLLAYYARLLPDTDAAEIDAHLKGSCAGTVCTSIATLAQMPRWIAEHVSAVASIVRSATALEAPLPDAGLVYASSTDKTPLYSARLQHQGWEINLEQSGTDAFFVGIRSTAQENSPASVSVALIRGSHVVEARFEWDQSQHWHARGFIPGATEIFRARGPFCVVIISQPREGPPAETR